MAGSLQISNLRNIGSLRFEIPDRGVWLLTAGNGAGKTSLLACLRRIGHPNAFQVHFPASLRSERLDNHSNGSVTYEINGETVEYAYRGERWTPRPRSNSNLFSRFGYASVTYIGANADRITPRPEDFDTRHIRAANRSIIDGANEIFETQKFSNLRTINLSRGVGNDAFVLAIGNTPTTYHSEKHFSLGELCVLKLLRLLQDVSNNSMLIVDELEMALHPRAQVKLLRYLERQSSAKSLTIIFSTHSVTLLKTINRSRIIYLDRISERDIKPIYGCFPTYAIGNITSDEETLPDVMIYVEDVYARDMLSAYFELFSNSRFSDPTTRPTAKILPVGGFTQVVAFLDRNRAVLPEHVVQKAALDQDVADESLAVLRRTENHAELAKFQRVNQNIDYLPFTPEVGLLTHAKADINAFEQSLRQRFRDNQLRISHIIESYNDTLQGGALRSEAKRVSNALLVHIAERTQRSTDTVREMVCELFAAESWQQYRPAFMALFGPMIR